MSQQESILEELHTAPEIQRPYTRSSSQARDITRGFLSALTPQPSPEAVDTAVLVVSELVTNALRHTPGLTQFQLGATRHRLHITVADASAVLPQERSPDPAGDVGGFGWPLVRHFAEDVTITLRSARSKSIQVTLPL